MPAWVAQFRPAEAAAAVALRQTAGLEVAEAEGFVWIRGSEWDEVTSRRLRCLPLVEIFDWCRDDQLVVQGHRVPTRRLPAADWVAIGKWFQLELPAAAWPGVVHQRTALRPVRARNAAAVSLLLTTVNAWEKFGVGASSIRLEPLRFAAHTDGRVIVQGHPLPALRGTRMVVTRGVAVPAGWWWQPAVDAVIVADLLRLADGDVALLLPDGVSFMVEVITRDQFVAAARGAIRATAEEFASG